MDVRRTWGRLLVAVVITLAVLLPQAPVSAAGKARTQRHRITQADREAAAARRREAASAVPTAPGTRTVPNGARNAPLMGAATMAMPMPGMLMPGATPDYFNVANWANSPQLRKFVDRLPGVGAANANGLGQFLPVAVADIASYPGADYYEIGLVEYTQQMHTDLPAPTKLRGYVQLNDPANPVTRDATGKIIAWPRPQYLGPLIFARKDRPVRVKFVNLLPTGAGGDLFLPVDTTVMGAGMGPFMHTPPVGPMNYTQNRAAVHLHGGRTPWISDGTAHQWITPAGEITAYPKGVSVQNVPDMPDPGDGATTFYYSNQQSARLMFYHDHAYGITRLNVYAGEAAAYILSDTIEDALITQGRIPAEQIPLIIQDKTFVPDLMTLAQTDPTWDVVKWGGPGSLWTPHVYMPNQNPWDQYGVNAYGRWDYGPWFWPPWPADNGPVPIDPANPNGPQRPGVPNISMGMEAFHDTALVNGTAYPYLDVQPKAYRFRILNAANDRFWNLQLYIADPAVTTTDGRTNTEVKMLPSIPGTWPADWPKPDLRDGGLPDPTTKGPNIIQIGTEGGFLPAPVVFTNIPIGWDTDPKSMTVGNIKEHNLFLGPAERADVVIDFSAFAGKTLILYNDAPAAVPARDPRYDYYTGNEDLTSTGGAPSTQAGYGPNIRTVMQIRVANTTPAAPYDLAALQSAFQSTAAGQGVFALGQDPVLVPQGGYNSAYNAAFPVDRTAYARIQDTGMTFTPMGSTTPMTVAFESKAIAEEFESTYGRMSGFLGIEVPFTNGMNQTTIFYTIMDPATEIVKDNMTPLTPVAGDGTQIWKITHNGVDTHPVHFHYFDVQLINRVDWAGVVKPPEPNELGWKETVRMNPLEDCIVALRPVACKLPFGCPKSIRPLDPTMPIGSTMGFKNVDPLGNPITVTNQLADFDWEYMWHCHILSHEEMDMMRPVVMNVTTTLPATPNPLALGTGNVLTWIDPTPAATSMGNPANEVGFAIERAENGGAFSLLKLAPANTTRYTDTTRQPYTWYQYRVYTYNASGDSLPTNTVTVLAAPSAPAITQATPGNGQVTLTFTAPASNGGTAITGYAVTVNPGNRTVTGTASPITVTGLTNGTAYTFTVAAVNSVGTGLASAFVIATPATVPGAPIIGTATAGNGTATVTFTAPASNGGTAITGYLVTVTNGGKTATGTSSPITVTGLAGGLSTAFTVAAINAMGTGPASAASNTVVIGGVPAAPTGRSITVSPIGTVPRTVTLVWYDNSTNETGFTVQRATNTAFTTGLITTNLGANVTTLVDSTVTAGTVYYYRVQAFNLAGTSAWSSTATATVTAGTLPSAPTNLRITATTRTSQTLAWTDNATNETGYYVERGYSSTGPWTRVATLGANVTSRIFTGLTPGVRYYYRVCAFNAAGSSAYTAVINGATLP
jgi:FtsP/CotA-like multicopper oxidase with cupredoxin domain